MIIRRLLISFCSIIILSGCASKSDLTFGDFVELENIESIEMTNNSGRFELNHEQLNKIIDELSDCEFDPDISVKVGFINLKLKIEGIEFYIISSTHGNYFEVPNEIATKNRKYIKSIPELYFKMNDINFDNYKEE